MSNDRLEEFTPIFYPKWHAVIGASADTQKFSGRFRRLLLALGYAGKLYPVNLTLERAAKALVNLIGYYERCDAVSSAESSK